MDLPLEIIYEILVFTPSVTKYRLSRELRRLLLQELKNQELKNQGPLQNFLKHIRIGRDVYINDQKYYFNETLMHMLCQQAKFLNQNQKIYLKIFGLDSTCQIIYQLGDGGITYLAVDDALDRKSVV